MSTSTQVINDVLPRTQIVATASQTVFDCNWTADAASDIKVYRTPDGDAPDDATQLVSSNDYTVSFIGGSLTVRVTFGVGVDEDDLITIVRDTPADRTNLYTNTNFTPTMLNQDFGVHTLVDQQAQLYNEEITPRYNLTATIEDKDKILPTLNAQQVWRMNEDNTGFEAFTIDGIPAPSNSYFVTYGADPSLENEQNLALLGNGILKQTVSGGFATLDIAVPGTDYIVGPLGTMAYQDANNVNITGGSAALGSGSVATAPTSGLDLTNKDYVDTVAAGFSFVSPTQVATTVDLNATYNNGALGVGATLTCNVNGAITVDGVALNPLDRIIVKDQSNQSENGIYFVTTQGDGSNPFVITRATDYDTASEVRAGTIIFVLGGNTYTNASFVETAVVTTIGTSPIVFQQFSQTFPLSMGNGGTGSSITPIASAVFSTNGSSVGQLSSTLPSGLTIPGYAASGANSDITSMSGLTGALRAPTGILDSNGNEVVTFSGVASAVNEINFTNAVTGSSPEIRPQGGDTNINMVIRSKGTGILDFTSENTSTPVRWYTGTGLQHTTAFSVPNTAAGRTITLQDADGTMAYLADRGMVLMNTFTTTGVTDLGVTNMTGYSNYMIIYNNVKPVANNVSMLMRVSTNNGAPYLATAIYNFQNAQSSNAVLTAAQGIGTSSVVLSNGWNNSVNVTGGGYIIFNNLGSGDIRKNGLYSSIYVNSAANMSNFWGGWQANTSGTAINAIQLFFSSGNIDTGTWYLYGIK